MTGFIVSAFAISPLPMSYLALYLVNPDNLEPDTKVPGQDDLIFGEEVANKVPYFLRVFSAVCFILGIIGVLMILDPIDDTLDNTSTPSNRNKSNEIELQEFPAKPIQETT